MSMVIKNNMNSIRTLNTFNHNNSELSKSIEKVSTGQKIISAKDDSSAYAISESMRIQIRALDQNNKNIQNGSALLRNAAGGIDKIVDALRNLKELTVNALNDTNSDIDRATMQKEFDQRVDTIRDLVNNTTYNGISLISGAYGIRVEGKEEPTGPGDLSNLTKSFKPYENAKVSSNLNSLCRIDGSYLKAQNSFERTGGSVYKVEVSFSGLNAGSDVAANLHGKGFIVLCSGCSQYLNVKFDANTDTSSYNDSPDPSNSLAREYTIGIKNLTSINDLAAFMYNGIKSSNPDNSSAGNTIVVDTKHSVSMEKTFSGKYLMTKEGSLAMQFLTGSVEGGQLVKDDSEEEIDDEEPWAPKVYSPLTIQHGTKANQSTKFYLNDMSLKHLRTRVIHEKDIATLESLLDNKEEYEAQKKYMVSVKGVSVNDINYLEKIRENTQQYEDYKEILKSARKKTLEDALITTRQNAEVAQRLIEGAIDYSLEQATSVGAYLQRLDYTDKNVTTMSENAQAAESTIRDADMAKEMTNYTKNNLLTQASQTMLAQANQDSSQVLGLLQ